MADEFIGGVAGGMRAGTNPVAHVQLIVYNASTAEWKNRKANAANAKYGGPVDHDHMTTVKAEPMVFERSTTITRYTGSLDKESSLRLFSCLNGYGRKEETYYDILDRLRWGGFKGYRTLEDDQEMDTQIDFPTYFGGLFSTVNNGPDVIFKGDLIYWDIPTDERHAQEIMDSYRIEGRLSGKRGDRRTVFIRPYNPKDQRANKKHIRFVAAKEISDYKKTTSTSTRIYEKASSEVFEAMKALVGFGFILGRTGVDPSAFGDKERARSDILTAFARNATDVDISSFFNPVNIADNDTKGAHFLMQALVDIIAPEEYGDFVASGDITDPSRAEVMKRIQKGYGVTKEDRYPALLERILKNVVTLEDFIKRRIVARAITDAASGQPIDIIAIP